MKYVINGKIFTKKRITGLLRYMIELLKVIDKKIENIKEIEIEILIPEKTYNLPELKNIKYVVKGKLIDNIWEQITLYLYAKKTKRTIINMSNTAPILKPDILIVHDINITKNSSQFNFIKVLFYKILYSLNIKRAKKLITVSNFSKEEISKYYKIDKNKIIVVPNAWQHVNRIKEKTKTKASTVLNYDIVQSNNNDKKEYFFTWGSIDKHKNIEWVYEVAKHNTNYNFYISGLMINKKIMKNKELDKISNVKYLGYVPDEEIIDIIVNSKALIAPSLYEGFGLTVIEALALGTKIIISDIPVFREIYGNSAYYIDPYNPDINLDKLLDKNINSREDVLKKYDWERSGDILLNEILKE